MAVVYVLFILILGAHRLPGFNGQVLESRGGEADPSVVMQCKGSDVMLNKATLGANILHVFVSRGDESLASSSVAATGQFQERLTVESNGRVTLANLTMNDLGMYRVELKLPEDRKIQSSLRLVISEPPVTTDRQLLVNKVSSSESNSVRLTCGNFTSLGFPSVSVIWKDPHGKIVPSDGFKEQVFYLDLPLSSAVSGDYCCQLDCRAPDYCCLDDRSSLRQCAPVHVQTNTAEEVRKVDCPSLDTFTHLQQQVLDLAVAMRVLQESDRQDCSQSGMSTIAQLVQRQAKCDQLDTYMGRIEDMEDNLKRDLHAAMNDSADFGLELETRLMKLQEKFRIQVTDVVDRLESTANSSRETLQTRLEEMSKAIEDHQSRAGKHLADLENETMTNVFDLRTAMDNHLSKIEGNLRLQLTEMATSTALLSARLDTLETSTNSSRETLQTILEEMSKAVNDHQTIAGKHIAELEKETKKTFVNLQTGMGNNLSKIEGNLRLQLTEMATSTTKLSDRLNRLETSTNGSQETLQARLEGMSKTMNDHQTLTGKQLADLEKETKKTFVDMQTAMDNKLARIEGKLSELVAITAENLTRSGQALASLEVKTASQNLELKNKLSTIQGTLTSHVTSTSQLHDSLRSDVAKLIQTTQSLKVGYCPGRKGYTWFNRRCIKISDDATSYQTAKANCLSEEAHLVIIKSRDVDAPVLRDVLTADGITLPPDESFLGFWVGADDISTEGSFVWNDGSPLPTSSALWYKGEPNSQGDEDCVLLYINRDVMSMNDNNCGRTYRYFCEFIP